LVVGGVRNEGSSLVLDFNSSGARRAREPIFFIPGAVLLVVCVLLGIHAGLTILGAGIEDAAIRELGFMPGRLTIALWPERLAALVSRASHDPVALEQTILIRHFGVLDGGAKIWTLASYALLHGSWSHVIVNCIWLLAFGPPTARRIGPSRFLLFMVVTAVAGALAQWAFSPMDFTPLIGASAADSGLMAAAARFMFQPGAPLGITREFGAGRLRAPSQAPAESLREVLSGRRVLIFIAIWMATNFLFGAGAQKLGASEAPVAWFAHIGGFIAGLLLFPLFDPPRAPASAG
jgi:membrane associated rhomboid family serine protease